MKLARTSRFTLDHKGGFYTCLLPWPEDAFVQAGDSGIVVTTQSPIDVMLSLEKSAEAVIAVLDKNTQPTPTLPFYRTAFFEASVNNPDTFIRGEGKTIEEAEQSAYDQFIKYQSCQGHPDAGDGKNHPHGPYEPRDYKNGAGYCVHCGLWFPHVIPPFHLCIHCGTPTWFSQDNQDDWWCQSCYPLIPQSKLTLIQIRIKEMQLEFKDNGEGDIEDA